MTKRFVKDHLSIQSIGRNRFWMGIFAGLFTAFLISLVFNHFREVYRYFTSMSTDLLILKDNELLFFNCFFSTLATTLGFSITIWIWMSNHTHKRRLDRMYKQLAVSNALLIFWVILMVIARFGSIPPIVLYGMAGYDNYFNLYEDYQILFILMPIVIFMQSWASVRLVYRSEKWILLSFVFCILTAFTLKVSTSVNQGKLNSIYLHRFKNDYQYVDQEISKSKAEYGIQFDIATIDILKKWYTDSSVKQVISIKEAFSGNARVSLDTIILQKIVIRNFKQGGWHYDRRFEEYWPYALPLEILKQIRLFAFNSNETKELFEVLAEEINLVNASIEDNEELSGYDDTERRRAKAGFIYKRSLMRKLKAVKDSLLQDDRYASYVKDLPEMEGEN